MEKIRQRTLSSTSDSRSDMVDLPLPAPRLTDFLSVLLDEEDLSTRFGSERSLIRLPLRSMNDSNSSEACCRKILDTIDSVLRICEEENFGDLEPTILTRGRINDNCRRNDGANRQ